VLYIYSVCELGDIQQVCNQELCRSAGVLCCWGVWYMPQAVLWARPRFCYASHWQHGTG